MSLPKAIVTDIEGTTTAISFVHQVLFPYADERLDAFVAAHRDEPHVASALAEVAAAIGEPSATQARLLAELHSWIAHDRKLTPLKALQGWIWAEGYADGSLRSHVYPDVPPVLRAWHDAGIALYVYSSGSIAAQRVLFGNSHAGDLTPLFSGYFDTTTGPKRERSSYVAIARAIGFEAQEILFLSDIEEELDAAQAAGMRTARLLRSADSEPQARSKHPAFAEFTSLATSLR